MVVVSSDGADGSEGEGGGADGSVMLNAEEDSLHDVSFHNYLYMVFQELHYQNSTILKTE